MSIDANSSRNPRPSAKNITGDFTEFTDFMRRLMAVPHAEVKAKLDAEKLLAKKRKKLRSSASLDSGAKA